MRLVPSLTTARVTLCPSCVLFRTPSGNLRFFVEHWHGTLARKEDASTMVISEEITGLPAVTDTKFADGMFNNKDVTAITTGWGCIGDAPPTVVRTCRSHSNVINHSAPARTPAGEKHDW